MIIKAKELINIKDSKIYDININNIHFDNNLFVKDINDVKGILEFYYDASDSLSLHYELNCNITIPGTLTPNDVSYSDYFEDDEYVCFSENEDGFYIKDNSSDIEVIKSIILPLIPIKAENGDDNMVKVGDGWTITSEKEYAKMNKEKVDPRLEVLKNYKEDK